MSRSKDLLLIRYISLLAIVVSSINFMSEDGIITIIITLSLIINNQLRVFFINKNITIYISIVIEIIITTILCTNYEGNIVIYYIPVMIDVFLIEDERCKNLFKGFMLGVATILSIKFQGMNIVTNICFISSVYILIGSVVESNKKKREAQVLYDKLRVSEEELKKANASLEIYSKSVEELAILKERNRISREIHDSVGHTLSTTIIQLQALEVISKKQGCNVEDMVKNLREFVNESYQDVRKAVNDLKPTDYNSFESFIRFEELINNFNKLTGIDVKLSISQEKWNLSSKQFSNIYRIFQESLSNSARHGKASKIDIFMNFTKSQLVMTIRDNGTGCNEVKKTGVGIKSIEERVSELKGEVQFTTALNLGFSVKIMLPKVVEV